MRFKPIRHIGVPYKRQVMIYATCLNYHTQPQEIRDRIDELCKEICEDAGMAAALKEVLTTDGNMEEIALRYYVSQPALSRRRAAFYRRFRP